MINFQGPARKLSDDDVRIIAGYLGCEIAAVRAVLAVESNGRGFTSNRPTILNEPHVFYRELKGMDRSVAVQSGLAYAKWRTKPYPKTQDARYAWLSKAMQIDEAAALKSCSWGLGQMMGFNHKACGFGTVQEFVRSMCTSEGAQLYAMARFIVSKGLQQHMRAKDWARFAYGYNGAGYKANAYDTKIAAAYAARPASERIVPPPATPVELAALRGAVPVPPRKPTKEVTGTIAGGTLGAGTAASMGADPWIVGAIFAAAIVAAIVLYKVKRA